MSTHLLTRLVFTVSLVGLLLAGASGTSSAASCPICGQPTVTLSERFAKADAALLVEWVSSRPAKGEQPDSSTYQVVETPRPGATKLEKGDRLTVPGHHAGKPGNLVFLMGRKLEDGKIQWDHPPLDVTETSYQYILQAPSPEANWEKRLAYFVKFLEYPDLTISNDAFAEFVNAPAKDIAAVASLFPREKLRRWLSAAETPINRTAAYALMLGLCGDRDDARLLEQKVFAPEEDRNVRLEGAIVGYLLLTGETGLKRIVQEKLKSSAEQEGDTFASLTALRYLWSYGNGRISAESLIAAVRVLLDNPTFAEVALTDLTRWKDWSLQARLMKLYGAPGFDDSRMKKAVIGFLIACSRDVPKGSEQELPAPVREARANLEKLREREPSLVAETEKFFFLK